MKLTLKLNLDNFENQEIMTNEYETLEPCYREQIIFLKGWVDYTPFAQPLIDNILKILGEGETSEIVGKPMISTNQTDRNELKVDSTDSKPLETTKENELKRSLYPETKGIDFQKLNEKTAVKETRNFVDVRECKNYTDKSYKLIGFDMKYTFIAKQHVIRTEVILGGGTRVLVSPKSAWVLTKLGWK